MNHPNQPQESAGPTVPFYPVHLSSELRVMAGLVLAALLVGGLGLIWPVGQGAPADPLETPAHVKPEWYFLGLYQVLKYVPKDAGVVIPLAALALLTILPFIDRRPDTTPQAWRWRLAGAALLIAVLAALTIWGEFS